MARTAETKWKPNSWSYVVAYLFGSMLGAVAAEMVAMTPAEARADQQTETRRVVEASSVPQAAELASFLHADTVRVRVEQVR